MRAVFANADPLPPPRVTLEEIQAKGGFLFNGNTYLLDDEFNVFRVRADGTLYKSINDLAYYARTYGAEITLPAPGSTVTITF